MLNILVGLNECLVEQTSGIGSSCMISLEGSRVKILSTAQTDQESDCLCPHKL